MSNTRLTKRYALARERVRKLLKADKVKFISSASNTNGYGAHTTIHLKGGGSVVYRGEIALPIRKFIWKKRYCKSEMNEGIRYKH